MNILWCTDIYEITVLLLKTLRFPEIIRDEAEYSGGARSV